MELHAVVVSVAASRNSGIQCRTFDALDGCMHVNQHRSLGVCFLGLYFLSVAKSNHHWGRVENFPVRNEVYTANATENSTVQTTRMVEARAEAEA